MTTKIITFVFVLPVTLVAAPLLSIKSLKTMTIGPGNFVFTFEELEFWGETCFLTYKPELGAVGSFNAKVTCAGG